MSQNKRKIEERKKLRKDGQGDDVCEACSASSNLHVPSSMPGKVERDRRMGEGARKLIEKRVGKVGTSGTVSHCVTLVSRPLFDARNDDQRKREKSKQLRE